MKRTLAQTIVILTTLLSQSAYAQLTTPYIFTNGTVANGDEVNANFAQLASALNRTGGTMTGTLNTLNVLPTVTNASDLGSTSLFYRTAYLRTSLVFGQAGGNYTITPANPAASRALSLNDPGGSDAFAYLAATQTLTNKTLTAPTISSPVLSGSVTGTYTLAGTPTITSPAISNPVFSGTATGTYTLGGTPSISVTALTGTTIPASVVTSSLTTVSTLIGGAIGAAFGAIDVGTDAISGGPFTGTILTLAGNGGANPTLLMTTADNQFSLSWKNGAGTNTWATYAASGSPTRLNFRDVVNAIDMLTLIPNTGITVTGTAGVSGNFSVNTNKFTVTASSGDSLAAGTFAWGGGSAITSSNSVPLLASVNTFTAFGLHTWTAGSNGTQRIVATNTTSGTAATSAFRGDAGTNTLLLEAFSQGFTTSSFNILSSVKLESTGANGLNLVTSNAAGVIGFWTNSALRWGINAAGDHLFGASSHIADSNGTPVITSGYGTITGTDYALRVIAPGGSITGGVITFGHTFSSAPVCTANADGTFGVGQGVSVVTTTTTVTLSHAATAGAASVFQVLCRGF